MLSETKAIMSHPHFTGWEHLFFRGRWDLKQAFDSIAGNTVVPYRSLKKFFNYHKLPFIAIYNIFNFQIKQDGPKGPRSLT